MPWPWRRREETDHPRSRGVYAPGPSGAGAACGSSPLARGLRTPPALKAPGGGIIPARAGFTQGGPGAPGRDPDHPRSRGVYPPRSARWRATTGSSPLARGLLPDARDGRPTRRIIPARAGFTSRRSPSVTSLRDHPRSRGVYGAEARSAMDKAGSSPLARGLRGPVLVGDRVLRIIPARAGFTPFSRSIRRMVGDHPRSRGVYSKRAH